MSATTIRLNIIEGDALSLTGDVLIAGARSPALSAFADGEQRFEPLVLSDRPHSMATATFRSCTTRFGHVVGLKCRFGRSESGRIADDLSDVLTHCLRRWQARSIVMVPLSWRHPRIVAFNMLYALWMLAYFHKMILGQGWPDPSFTIATLRNSDLFTELVDYDARVLRAAVHERYEAARKMSVFALFAPPYDEGSVAFQVHRRCREQA